MTKLKPSSLTPKQIATIRGLILAAAIMRCPASSPLRRNGGVEERRISGSS
jgi:hypothetical protein